LKNFKFRIYMEFIFQVTAMDQLSKSPNQGLNREKNFQEANFVNKYQLWVSWSPEPLPLDLPLAVTYAEKSFGRCFWKSEHFFNKQMKFYYERLIIYLHYFFLNINIYHIKKNHKTKSNFHEVLAIMLRISLQLTSMSLCTFNNVNPFNLSSPVLLR
jgi:hypothetical protein